MNTIYTTFSWCWFIWSDIKARSVFLVIGDFKRYLDHRYCLIRHSIFEVMLVDIRQCVRMTIIADLRRTNDFWILILCDSRIFDFVSTRKSTLLVNSKVNSTAGSVSGSSIGLGSLSRLILSFEELDRYRESYLHHYNSQSLIQVWTELYRVI